MNREEILREATKCVCGGRESDHGRAESNIGLISDLWSSYMGTRITPIDVCMLMCMLKIARIKSGTAKEDSFIDICGYSSIGGEIAYNWVEKEEYVKEKNVLQQF